MHNSVGDEDKNYLQNMANMIKLDNQSKNKAEIDLSKGGSAIVDIVKSIRMNLINNSINFETANGGKRALSDEGI